MDETTIGVGPKEASLDWRATPESCDRMRYEGDASGYALHVSRAHGVEVPDRLFDAWCESMWLEIDRLHEQACRG